MRRIKGLICFVVCVLFATQAFAQTKIIAQVNDDIISELDFEQRLKFIGLTGQADVKDKAIQKRLLKQMIDEKLKQQEARFAGIKIDQEEVKQAVKITLKQNDLEYDKMLELLKQNHLPLAVLEEQIKSDLLYIRAIKKLEARKAVVSDYEVDSKIKEMLERVNQKQYLLSEIVLPIENKENDAEVYGQAMKLIMRLYEGETFESLVKEYSQGSSKDKEGLVGWVGENTLGENEKEEIAFLQIGQVSAPVQTEDAYKIYVLRAKRAPEDFSKEQTMIRLMQLFIPDAFSKEKRQSVLRDVAMVKGSCEQFLSLSQELNTAPRMDLGALPLTELPVPIQHVLKRTAVLEPSAPLKIEDGELVFMMCERQDVSALPAKEKVKEQLEASKLEILAQRRLRQLRRTALTELR